MALTVHYGLRSRLLSVHLDERLGWCGVEGVLGGMGVISLLGDLMVCWCGVWWCFVQVWGRCQKRTSLLRDHKSLGLVDYQPLVSSGMTRRLGQTIEVPMFFDLFIWLTILFILLPTLIAIATVISVIFHLSKPPNDKS